MLIGKDSNTYIYKEFLQYSLIS